MNIIYAYTILYVKDVEKALAFYIHAFGFEQKFLTPEKDYGELISGSTTIAFANIELGESNIKKGFTASNPDDVPFGIELAFTSSDVEKAMQQALENGATILEKLVTKPWGQQVGYVRDIDGFIIELCSPMSN